MNYELAVKNIRRELKAYIQKNKIKSLIIGISGGMDSCLCAALAKPVCDELNIPLIGRSLPISTNTQDEINRAKLTGNVFCTNFREDNLATYYNALSVLNTDPSYEYIEAVDKLNLSDKDNDKAWKIRCGNMKARIRMIYLYNLASLNQGMVLSTDNFTEYLLGFWTLHGDVGDYGMIQELWKSEVYDMAEYLTKEEYNSKNRNAYEALMFTIRAMATDGLGVTSKGDLGQIMPEFEGSSRDGYKEVDDKLKAWKLLFDEAAKTPKVIKAMIVMSAHPVIERHLNSQFKRNNPVNIPRNLIIQ